MITGSTIISRQMNSAFIIVLFLLFASNFPVLQFFLFSSVPKVQIVANNIKI